MIKGNAKKAFTIAAISGGAALGAFTISGVLPTTSVELIKMSNDFILLGMTATALGVWFSTEGACALDVRRRAAKDPQNRTPTVPRSSAATPKPGK